MLVNISFHNFIYFILRNLIKTFDWEIHSTCYCFVLDGHMILIDGRNIKMKDCNFLLLFHLYFHKDFILAVLYFFVAKRTIDFILEADSFQHLQMLYNFLYQNINYKYYYFQSEFIQIIFIKHSTIICI